MSTASFAALAQAVIASSVGSHWSSAVLEWEVTDVDHDPRRRGVCVCGQTGLADLFTISNLRNGAVLHPIGSTCVNQFGRADLDRQVNVLGDLLRLRLALEAGDGVDLSSRFFSRALLAYLRDAGVFTPDQWNHGNGDRDYDFLLEMFNKRNKEEITRRQHAKITALLRTKVFPFVSSGGP